MPSPQEIAAYISAHWDELNREGKVNRDITLEAVITQMLQASAKCIYCGSTFNLEVPSERERLADHILSCEKSPLVQQVKAAVEAVDAFATAALKTDEYVKTLERNNAELEAQLAQKTASVAPSVEQSGNTKRSFDYASVKLNDDQKNFYQIAKEAVDKLVLEKNITVANLTRDQIAEAFLQALQCGDFTRLVRQGDSAQAIVYVPFTREQDLITKHNKVTQFVEKFLIPHRTQIAECWLDGFVECGAVTIDKTYPYGYVAAVKL